MRVDGRLPLCAALVLLAHAGLMAAWWQAAASGWRPPSPHERATVRLMLLGPQALHATAAPQPRPPALGGPSTSVSRAPAARPSPAAVPQALAIAAGPALAPDPVASAVPLPERDTLAPRRDFLAPNQVEHIAIAFPAPDASTLSGLSWSGMPIRLRIFISARGDCLEVQVLSASENEQTLDRVRQMLLDTHFIPAQQAGASVDSYRDIELGVSDVK